MVLKSDNYSMPKGSAVNKRKNLLFFFIAVVVALLLIFSGIWFYRQQAQAIRSDRFIELKSIADLKVNQILQWRKERISDVRMNASNPFVSASIVSWLADPEDKQIENSILESLILLKETADYQNIMLVDNTLHLKTSLDSQLMLLEPNTQELAARSMRENEILMGDFFRNPQTNQVFLDFVAPLLDEKKQPAGAIIFRVNPEEYLYPLIQSWPTPSETAETLLIRKELQYVVFLNTLRHDSSDPLLKRIPLSRTDVPAVQAVLGLTGDFEGLDYRGEKVLAEIVPIPGTPWFMISKVDSREILSETRSLWLTVLLLVVLSIIMVSALAAYFYQDRQSLLFQKLFRQERELREAQEETRMTLYSIGDGVITTDALGRVTRMNPVAENLTGWKESEAVGQKLDRVFKIIHENTRLEVENPVDRILREGRVIGLANHTLLISKDGQERPIADSGAPILNDKRGITGVVLVFRDQTEERDIQKEKAFLTNTIRSSLNEIYIFDSLTYKFRFVNDGAINNIGYLMEQLKNMTPLDIKPFLNIESFEDLIKPLRDQTKKNLVFETIHKRSNGSEYPVEVHLQLFDQGEEEVFLAVINDISERKTAESEIKLKDELLQLTGSMAKVGGWEFDAVTLEGTWTDEVAKIHDLDPGLETNVALGVSFYTEDSRKKIEKAIKEAIDLEKPYDLELEMVTARGVHKAVRTMGVPVTEGGKVVKVRGIFQDVSDLKRIENDLLESETRFRTLFEHAAVGVSLIDTKTGKYLDINQKYCDFLGYTKEEMQGFTIRDVTYPLDLKENLDKNELFLEGKIREFTIEKRYIHKDGRIVWGELTASPLWLSGEKTPGFMHIAVVKDITERKQTEEKIQSQLNELRRWHNITLNREIRILELKAEINDLLSKAGYPPRYESSEQEPGS